MNAIYPLITEIVVTFVVCLLLTAYFRPALHRLLVDLCGAEERARFWTTFSNIILVSLPLISALGFSPPVESDGGVYAAIYQIRANLLNFILGLAFVGLILLFFTASVSRVRPQNSPKS